LDFRRKKHGNLFQKKILSEKSNILRQTLNKKKIEKVHLKIYFNRRRIRNKKIKFYNKKKE
jgi:hypothetical protein